MRLIMLWRLTLLLRRVRLTREAHDRALDDLEGFSRDPAIRRRFALQHGLLK